jgi:hypothetical protein
MATFVPAYVEIKEPRLRFHSTEEEYCSINPIEGLNAWGPYDASIPGYLRPNPLRVAILSPEKSFAPVVRFLEKLAKEGVPHTSSDEYVVDWPGFRHIFQTNLEFPTRLDERLVEIVPEDAADEAQKSSQPEIAFLEGLKKHISVLLPIRHEFDVLLIHIPTRWAMFRERRDLGYHFDLHDALKVFSAPNNLIIQLVEEDSFSYQDQARVMWWLALALYVKGRGIPWKLADPSPGTAFVGLSYGISNTVASKRIILGCSQVFDENGEGLKFLLHPVESPIFRGKNPFMSREDARRLFGKVRDIYQDVNGARPQRVVVHKTTHFTRDEMDGIATALSGIEEIELLQIQQDTGWRAIAYDGSRNLVSNFPVKRGTALPLDRYTFLLWTQGDIAGISAKGRHYYQEKRGIPAPLVIRRFRGSRPLEQVASEILRLTKMNWNNHQLYNRLPVTITFSDELSEIAKQVQQVWRVAYDFRHFM